MSFNPKLQNNILYEEGTLPKDFGTIKAKEALEKVHNGEKEYKPEFLEEMRETINRKLEENDKSVEELWVLVNKLAHECDEQIEKLTEITAELVESQGVLVALFMKDYYDKEK